MSSELIRTTSDLEAAVDEDGEGGLFNRARSRITLQMLVFSVPVVWIVGAGWTHRSIRDDGFIYLRIVRQLEAGNGPVFNAGERVETYTGVLWLGLLSVADVLTPFTLEWIAVVMGLALTTTGVILAMTGARRLANPGATTVFAPLGALVFVALYPTWVFATSGLETGLVFAWLGACLWVLARWANETDRTLSIPECVLLGLGWLVRPELVLFSAIFLTIVIVAQWRTHSRRANLRVIVATITIPLLYQIFRMGYFGNVVANTAITKDGSSTDWERGMRYLSDFTGPYRLWLPLLGLLLAGYVPLGVQLARDRCSREAAVTLSFVGCGVVLAGYVVAVGGDYLHGRLFLPALFAICAPVAAVPLARSRLIGLLVAGWAVAAVAGFRPVQLGPAGQLANGVVMPVQDGKVTLEDFGWDEDGPLRQWYVGPGIYFEQSFAVYERSDVVPNDDLADAVGAFFAIGISGYAMGTDFQIYDMLGLADPLTARLETAPTATQSLRLAGHEKPSPQQWTGTRLTPIDSAVDPADFPEAVLLLPAATGQEFDEQVAWARAALECKPIVELLEGVRGRLTIGKFFDNLVHSPQRTRLTIPAEPETAYRKFCGDGVPDGVERVRAGAT